MTRSAEAFFVLTAIIRNKMLISYSLDFRDYKAAQTLHAKRNEIPYFGYCAARYIYPVLGLCILALEFTPLHFVGMPQGKMIVTVCGLFFLCFPLYVHWKTRRSYDLARSGCSNCIIEFDQELIRMQGPHVKSEMEWTAIHSSAEDSNTFLLYLAPARFVVIPKRACTNEQMNELRTLLQEKVKSNSVCV